MFFLLVITFSGCFFFFSYISVDDKDTAVIDDVIKINQGKGKYKIVNKL